MPELSHPLSDAQIASFIADGVVRIDNAFTAFMRLFDGSNRGKMILKLV